MLFRRIWRPKMLGRKVNNKISVVIDCPVQRSAEFTCISTCVKILHLCFILHPISRHKSKALEFSISPFFLVKIGNARSPVIWNRGTVIWNQGTVIWNRGMDIWNRGTVIWQQESVIWNPGMVIWNQGILSFNSQIIMYFKCDSQPVEIGDQSFEFGERLFEIGEQLYEIEEWLFKPFEHEESFYKKNPPQCRPGNCSPISNNRSKISYNPSPISNVWRSRTFLIMIK